MIYNPVAGQRLFQKAKPVAAIAEALGKHVGEVFLYPTTAGSRAGEKARQALSEGCDLIAPLGGDGTINESLQVVADTDATLFPLPGGTANVLARELGLGLDPVRVAASLPDLEERSVQVGAVIFDDPDSRRLFLLMCGAGLDANAVSGVNVTLKKRVGILAYVWSGLQQVLRPLNRLQVDLDGESIIAGLAVVSKSKLYGGGLTMAPDAHLLDGAFEVVCFPAGSTLKYPGYLAAVVAGRTDNVAGIQRRRVTKAVICAASEGRAAVQVDGELVGGVPVTVQMGPERLNLLGPSAYWSQLG